MNKSAKLIQDIESWKKKEKEFGLTKDEKWLLDIAVRKVAERARGRYKSDTMAGRIIRMLAIREFDHNSDFVKLPHGDIIGRLTEGTQWQPTSVSQRVNLDLRREGWDIINVGDHRGAVYQLLPNYITETLGL